MSKYKKYDEDFKKEMVRRHLEGETILSLNERFNISNGCLNGWKKKYRKEIELEMQNEHSNEVACTVEAPETNEEQYRKEIEDLQAHLTSKTMECEELHKQLHRLKSAYDELEEQYNAATYNEENSSQVIKNITTELVTKNNQLEQVIDYLIKKLNK